MDKLTAIAEQINERYLKVQSAIARAAERSGRKTDEVRLVAISKGQSIEKIRAGYAAGIREFGENRANEAIQKLQELEDLKDIQWHMVGHIQSRKAKVVVQNFHYVHSLDHLKLAQRLDRFANEKGISLPVLLECNVSGEASKYGWDLSHEDEWSAVLPEFNRILDYKNLEVRGLMTMAPWVRDEEILRSCFRRLRQLRSFLQNHLSGTWVELSMGMTDDFEYAVEEGATIVRIGRAIFGERGGKDLNLR